MSKELEELAKEISPSRLSGLARWFGEDWDYAVTPGFGWTGYPTAKEAEINYNEEQFKTPYRGQNLKGQFDTRLAELNDLYNVEEAPDLLGIFTGHTTPKEEGLNISTVRPSKQGGYPWGENTEVYDLSKYTTLNAFIGGPEVLLALKARVDDLGPREIISHQDLARFKKQGLNVEIHNSLDLGERVNMSIGKDDEGRPYLALSDTWDFKGAQGFDKIPSYLMEKFGKGRNVKDIGLYGRLYFDKYDYILPEQRDQHVDRKFKRNKK